MAGPDIEIWNVHDNIPIFVGAQPITNILGKVTGSVLPKQLLYSLNEGPPRPIYVKRSLNQAPRLIAIGDFHIDTLSEDVLRPTNTLPSRHNMRMTPILRRACVFRFSIDCQIDTASRSVYKRPVTRSRSDRSLTVAGLCLWISTARNASSLLPTELDMIVLSCSQNPFPAPITQSELEYASPVGFALCIMWGLFFNGIHTCRVTVRRFRNNGARDLLIIIPVVKD